MAFYSLTEFIEQLEREGELIRISEPVSPILEISEITDKISKSPGGGKALLFENVEGSQMPVLINAFGSTRRMNIALGVDDIEERHRHRYELNNAYRDVLAKAGLIASGLSPDGQLVEVCEMQDHPFMVGSQFHPEFQSRPLRPHPLFREFIGAVAAYAGQGESEGSEETAKIVSDVTSAAASGS